jgi:hypothetical protein
MTLKIMPCSPTPRNSRDCQPAPCHRPDICKERIPLPAFAALGFTNMMSDAAITAMAADATMGSISTPLAAGMTPATCVSG